MNGSGRFPILVLAPGAAALVALAMAAPALHWQFRISTGQEAQWLGIAIAGLTLACLGGIRFGVVCGINLKSFRAGELALCIMAVLVAIAALAFPPLPSIGVLIASYLLFALCDVLAVERGLLPQWFGLLRMWLTSGAVMLLLVMLAVGLI